MSNNPTLGFMRCPVCGAVNQDIRVNINKKLYMYCDHGCAVKFGSADSKKFLPALAGGKSVVTSTDCIIEPILTKESKENDPTKIRRCDERTPTAGHSGSGADRRPVGQPAENVGRANPTTKSVRDAMRELWNYGD